MAIVTPWFDASVDVGAPAFLQFWSSFLGQRSEINKQIMQERLAGADPAKLMQLEASMRENIVKLQQAKADLVGQSLASRGKLSREQMVLEGKLMDFTKAVLVANINNSGANQRAAAKNVNDLQVQIMKGSQDLAERRQGVAADQEVRSMVSNASRGAPKADAAKAAHYQSAWREIGNKYPKGSVEEAQAAAMLVKEAEDTGSPGAARAIRSQVGMPAGENPESWVDKRVKKSSEEIRDEAAFLSEEIRSGASMESVYRRAASIFGMPTAELRTAVAAEAGGIPTAQAETQRTILADMMGDLDVQIEGLEEEATTLKLQRQKMREGGGFFSGFMSNALLETQFQRPQSMKPAADVMRALSPDQRDQMVELLQGAGGDPRKALELFKQRKAEGVRPVPEVAVAPVQPVALPEIAPVSEQDILVENLAVPTAAQAVSRPRMPRMPTPQAVAPSAIGVEEISPAQSASFIPMGSSADAVAKEMLGRMPADEARAQLKASKSRLSSSRKDYLEQVVGDVQAMTPAQKQILDAQDRRMQDLDEILGNLVVQPQEIVL